MSYEVLPLRKRAEMMDKWLHLRYENLLPKLMKETGIQMWIVTSQEANEDPVIKTMLPYDMYKTAGRRTILVFFRKEDGAVERINIYKPGLYLDDYFTAVWTNDPDSDWSRFSENLPERNVNAGGINTKPETQAECLCRIINERNPKNIGLNISQSDNYGDGLSHGSYLWIVNAIGNENAQKIVSASTLATRWLETRIPEEIDFYHRHAQLTAAIIKDGLTTAVHPGITTCNDIKWWITQRFEDLNLTPCFPVSVTVRRDGNKGEEGDIVILEGDIIHCDAGTEYFGLNSDMQHNAYVPKLGETDIPAGIKALFDKSKRVETILAEEMKEGLTGNEVLTNALKRIEEENMDVLVYSHALGYYVHSAGPFIGMVDNQSFVKGHGEMVLHNNTVYAMEFCVTDSIPEWHNQRTTLLCETDVILKDGKVKFLYRQPKIHTCSVRG